MSMWGMDRIAIEEEDRGTIYDHRVAVRLLAYLRPHRVRVAATECTTQSRQLSHHREADLFVDRGSSDPSGEVDGCDHCRRVTKSVLADGVEYLVDQFGNRGARDRQTIVPIRVVTTEQ